MSDPGPLFHKRMNLSTCLLTSNLTSIQCWYLYLAWVRSATSWVQLVQSGPQAEWLSHSHLGSPQTTHLAARSSSLIT